MPQFSDIRMAQAGFADRKVAPDPAKYHPHCNEEHRHKPTKAVIGVAILIVLSFLLYGITGHANEPASTAHPQTTTYMR